MRTNKQTMWLTPKQIEKIWKRSMKKEKENPTIVADYQHIPADIAMKIMDETFTTSLK